MYDGIATLLQPLCAIILVVHKQVHVCVRMRHLRVVSTGGGGAIQLFRLVVMTTLINSRPNQASSLNRQLNSTQLNSRLNSQLN
jgi:hypothetical protein